jgi:hypothetical protein
MSTHVSIVIDKRRSKKKYEQESPFFLSGLGYMTQC